MVRNRSYILNPISAKRLPGRKRTVGDGLLRLPTRVLVSLTIISDLEKLNEIDWDAVDATDWQNCKDEKQAEFLLEHSFPWELVVRIGVFSQLTGQQASRALGSATHRPGIEIVPNWYY